MAMSEEESYKSHRHPFKIKESNELPQAAFPILNCHWKSGN